MIFLVLSILFASALPIVMRFGINKNVEVTSVNNIYRVTTGVVALIVILFQENPLEFIFFAIKSEVFLYGIVAGFLYWMAGYTSLKMLSYGDVGISWTIKCLSMVLPTFASIFYWHEIPLVGINGFLGLRGAGILAAILAIIFLGINRYESHKKDVSEYKNQHMKKWIFWLIAAFLTQGYWEIMLRATRTFTIKEAKVIFISSVFIVAMCISIPGLVAARKKIAKKEIGFGLLLGLCSLGGSGLRPWALKYVDGYILFPVTTISVSLLVLLGGYVIWKEKLGRFGFIGIACTIVGIILLAVNL